jgi:hypothetical protein
MTNEIAPGMMVIVLRNNIKIWVLEEKADQIGQDLIGEDRKLVKKIEGRYINTADVVGIFKPMDIDAQTKDKSGEWKCKKGNWHGRGEKCECAQSTSNLPLFRTDGQGRQYKNGVLIE